MKNRTQNNTIKENISTNIYANKNRFTVYATPWIYHESTLKIVYPSISGLESFSSVSTSSVTSVVSDDTSGVDAPSGDDTLDA